ncbi:hypothetical protein GCM10017708_39110 [Arthrobacter citreus]
MTTPIVHDDVSVRSRPCWLGAYAETGEGGRCGTGLFEHLCHGLLGVLREGLVQQDNLLEEAGQAAFNDLVQCGFGLALGACGLVSNAAFVLDRLSRNFVRVR